MEANRQPSPLVPGSAEAQDKPLNQALWCVFYGGGIIGTLMVYGLLQERIMTIPFGDELFTVSAFLVFSNRVVNVMYAATLMKVNGEGIKNNAPIWKYMVISLSNVVATTCQYECLKYVSFPVQMLGKSFKMMPVMLWGIAISGKKHGLMDWGVALAVTLGVTEFCMTGPMASPNDHGNSYKGFLLLAVFLACDGLTSTMQEKLFKEHNTSKFNQMFYVNGCSAITSLVTLLCMGSFFDCIAFSMRHADFLGNVAILSAAAAGSQYFIYSQVKEFGALVFAATMNVRQVVSILLSYVHFHHPISGLQSLGLLSVFGALFFKSYVGLMAPPKGKDKDEKVPLFAPAPDGNYASAEPKATA